MPYITTEQVTKIRKDLKEILNGFQFRCYKQDSTIHVTLQSGIINLIDEEKAYYDVNQYHLEWYDEQPEMKELFEKILKVMQQFLGNSHYDQDYGFIPTYYINLQVGEYNKPYVFMQRRAAPTEQSNINDIEIVEYSGSSFAVFGEGTYAVKEHLLKLGSYNRFLKYGTGKRKGYIFSNKRKEAVLQLLQQVPQEVN